MSRLSPVLHSGASALLLFMVIPLLLQAASQPPPAIAEFAPSVQQPIKDAPPDQTSAFGAAEGGNHGAGGPSATPTPSAQATQASPTPFQVPQGAKVRKCIGNPPRQIEDPQSPPCVPFWAGDNGGATSFGVTADTITLAVPDWQAQNVGDLQTLVTFFNDRYEFYGRKIVLKTFHATQNVTPAQMQADATAVHDQLKAFAVLGYPWQFGAETYFYDSLARLGIISAQAQINGIATADTAHLARMAPYEWNYVPTPDIDMRNLAEVVCKQLAGKPPTHAGSPTNTVPVRKFGILRSVQQGNTPFDISPLVDAIKSCTGSAPETADYTYGSSTQSSEIANALAQFNLDKVTSVSCICHPADLDGTVMATAAGQAYYPEWLVMNVIGQDESAGMFQAPGEEARHAIGIRSLNKQLPPAQTPYVWAVHYESPSNPKPPYQNTLNPWEDWFYHNLKLVADGIQQAGPRLTPQAFEKGLQTTEYPNPGCDGPPYFQACVGFQGGSHVMQKSFGLIWWNLNLQSPDSPAGYPGDYCNVGGGTRFSLGSFPNTDRFQTAGPC